MTSIDLQPADTPANVVSFFVDRHAQGSRAAHAAILHESGEITYAELAGTINQACNYLLELGVQPEQRVMLHLPDGPEWVFFFMAAIKIGAVAVPVSTFASSAQLAFYLQDSRAKVLVTCRQFAGKSPGCETTPQLDHVVYVDEEPWKRFSRDFPAFQVERDDTAFWLYTSGSTGRQKAVVHRHGAMLACAQSYCRDVLDIRPSDRCYSASKCFFAYGLGNSITFPFSVGATSILCSRPSDAETVVRTIRELKPTLFFGVPTIYQGLLKSTEVSRELFAGVRMCISAGEYLSETLFESWRDRTGQVLFDGIGTTEAMHIFCSNRPGNYKAGTSGLPVQGYELKVVDANGAELGPASVGRLLVRGSTLAAGYWHRHEQTQSSFMGEWLVTGDVYQRTEDGFYRYIGRQDDVFKSSGLWVSPGEIEQTLLTCPHVAEAAVVAIEHQIGTIRAKAFVVLAQAADQADPDSIRQDIFKHLDGRLSRYKMPAEIEFLAALPKTATGKILRAALRRSRAFENPVEERRTQ